MAENQSPSNPVMGYPIVSSAMTENQYSSNPTIGYPIISSLPQSHRLNPSNNAIPQRGNFADLNPAAGSYSSTKLLQETVSLVVILIITAFLLWGCVALIQHHPSVPEVQVVSTSISSSNFSGKDYLSVNMNVTFSVQNTNGYAGMGYDAGHASVFQGKHWISNATVAPLALHGKRDNGTMTAHFLFDIMLENVDDWSSDHRYPIVALSFSLTLEATYQSWTLPSEKKFSISLQCNEEKAALLGSNTAARTDLWRWGCSSNDGLHQEAAVFVELFLVFCLFLGSGYRIFKFSLVLCDILG